MTRSGGNAHGENGSAIVELALCLPVLILIVLGTGDFARAFYTSIALSDAARAGAQYGAHSVAQSGNTAGMQTAATSAVNVTGISATASRTCYCAANDGSSFTSGSCTATCSASQHLLVTVSVTASKTFATASLLPGIPNSIPLSRTATMRVAN
jgi:Flp pilus assembly protein TadG